jgi:hypothetical protein
MPRGPWCPEHKCHPDECFYIHYPEAEKGGRAPTEAELRNAIIREHVRRQNELIREQQAKPNPDVISMREKYEERRRRRGA